MSDKLITKTSDEVALLAQQAEAQFALTPMGQALKQFECAQRMGQMFATSTIVPETYRGNVANCAVAVDMAMRMGMPPVAVMQNLYIVHGMPAWSSKFLIACIKASGYAFDYECSYDAPSDADDYGWRMVAYAPGDTQRKRPLYGPWVTWALVKAEGWASKNGSKWRTMPELMFRYRAAAQWQRLFAPELAMGITTAEEAADIVDTTYTEVGAAPAAPAEPETPAIDPERVAEAVAALETAADADAVKALKSEYADVYAADGAFRDALIDKYQSF